jgi:GNAT superfamily N-acetyltransferase
VGTASAQVEIVPLNAETWDRLAALFREGGDPRWCWCQFWRMRAKDFGEQNVPQLRARLEEQASSAEPPGLVAVEGDRAVGWVSLGPRDTFERIVRSRVIPKVDDRPVWSIVCFAVSKSARGHGLARDLLAAAIDFATEHGAEALEAYPVDADREHRVSPEKAYRGTLSMFLGAGFDVAAERTSDSGGRRVVVRRELRVR